MKLRARNIKQILLLLSAFLLGLILITLFVSSALDGSLASIFSFGPYEENYESLCINTEWCKISMPKKSYFRFPQPPDNLAKWKKAAYAASQGEHVLLSKIIKYFPGYHDFLDGDGNFRHYHQLADYFFDHNRHFLGLTDRGMNHLNSLKYSPKTVYPFQKPGNFSVIPRVYDYRQTKRAPIIKLGYHAFVKYQRLTHFFSAETIGEVVIERSTFLKQWKKWSTKILYPFIFLHSSHQNWGFFSTYFPNRSGQWGSCCDNTAEEAETLQQFLDHNKTFLVLVNQHHNLTHPKIITLPRGLPTQKDYNTRKTVRDTMSVLIDQKQHKKRDHFLFATSSNWEFRPNIVECVSKKFEEEKQSKFYQLSKEIPLSEYYFELAQSKFSLALPALGYDTFKIWESLTLGTIPIVEKGVALDKTLWRLPALLVDDFDEVTPDLLRVAYIEALYRADEFEYERLTQSFWDTFISNVSQSSSASQALQIIFSKFPPESQDTYFTRPLQPFTCGENGELCGVGTKKTPKSTC